jgi:hypothetical protein
MYVCYVIDFASLRFSIWLDFGIVLIVLYVLFFVLFYLKIY